MNRRTPGYGTLPEDHCLNQGLPLSFQGPLALTQPVTHCHSLERLHDDPVDFVKQLAGHLSASGALQVESQVVDSPLSTMNMVVVILVREEGRGEGKWP